MKDPGDGFSDFSVLEGRRRDVAVAVKWTMREKGSGRKKPEAGFGRAPNIGASETFLYLSLFSRRAKLLLIRCHKKQLAENSQCGALALPDSGLGTINTTSIGIFMHSARAGFRAAYN